MNVHRIFFASFLIPLISVGLCVTGDGGASTLAKHRVHRNTAYSQAGSLKELENEDINSTVQFPPQSAEGLNVSLLEPMGKISLASGTTDSLPYHPHPLKLEVKSIKNSTLIDDSLLFLDHGTARDGSELWHFGAISWVYSIIWKVMTSYIFVSLVNIVFGTIWKKFGWAGPTWSFKTTLGKGPKDEDEGQGGHGGHGGHGNGWASNYGPHPHLSYDQYLAMPYVNKYSQKAAKKAAHYTKKAQKFAAKASKAAAKAHVYRLQVAPYTHGYLRPDQINQGHDCVNCKFN